MRFQALRDTSLNRVTNKIKNAKAKFNILKLCLGTPRLGRIKQKKYVIHP